MRVVHDGGMRRYACVVGCVMLILTLIVVFAGVEVLFFSLALTWKQQIRKVAGGFDTP